MGASGKTPRGARAKSNGAARASSAPKSTPPAGEKASPPPASPKSASGAGARTRRVAAVADAPPAAWLGLVDGLAPSTDPKRPDFAWWPIDRVKPWVQNPRKNARAVGKVADSIRRWGWGRPLVVNDWRGSEGEIIVGHTAWLAALELKLEHVPVRIRRIEPAVAHALALADNKLGEISDWDPDELGRIVGSGEIGAGDLALAGFGAEELAKLLEPVHPPSDFAEVTINAETQYTCPRCQYEWRGQPSSKRDAPVKDAAE